MKRGQGATKDKKVDANTYTHRPTKKPIIITIVIACVMPQYTGMLLQFYTQHDSNKG